MDNDESLPADVERFVATLEAEGFDLGDRRIDHDHFGNVLLLFIRHSMRVRIVSDRGQWFVEVGAVSVDGWFFPTVWRAYLDGSIGDLATPSFEAQCEIVLGKWAEMEKAVSSDADLTGQLLIARAKRSRARQAGSGDARSSG